MPGIKLGSCVGWFCVQCFLTCHINAGKVINSFFVGGVVLGSSIVVNHICVPTCCGSLIGGVYTWWFSGESVCVYVCLCHSQNANQGLRGTQVDTFRKTQQNCVMLYAMGNW